MGYRKVLKTGMTRTPRRKNTPISKPRTEPILGAQPQATSEEQEEAAPPKGGDQRRQHQEEQKRQHHQKTNGGKTTNNGNCIRNIQIKKRWPQKPLNQMVRTLGKQRNPQERQ